MRSLDERAARARRTCRATVGVALTALSTIALALLVPALASAAPDTGAANSLTDKYLFDTSLQNFTKVWKDRTDGRELDWSSDGCSVPKEVVPALGSKDKPGFRTFTGTVVKFDFLAACHRHDFGYRNYKEQDRFTEAAKARIDKNFHRDMYSVCRKYKGWKAAAGVGCRRIADGYYRAVSQFGH